MALLPYLPDVFTALPPLCAYVLLTTPVLPG